MLGVMKVFPGVRKKTQQGLALRGTGTFPSFRVRAVGSELSPRIPFMGLCWWISQLRLEMLMINTSSPDQGTCYQHHYAHYSPCYKVPCVTA